MLYTFLAWWKRHLLEIPPISWLIKRFTQTEPDGLMLTLTDFTGMAVLQAAKRGRRKLTPLGRFAVDSQGLAALRAAAGVIQRRAVQLLVAPHLLLERQVSLPLAAERELETALRWEMDRLTPFTADAVWWHWQVKRRDRQLGTVLVNLRLIPRASIETVLSMLAKAGLAPAIVVSTVDPTVFVPLSQSDRMTAAFCAERIMAYAAMCAMTAATTIPFVHQEQAFRSLRPQFAMLRPQVDAVQEFRRRMADRAATDDVMTKETARVGHALQILATVAEVLPDDTYLLNLTLSNRLLTLTGLSGGAARLIPLLATDPALLGPVFAAPVTRNESTKQESFSIRAEARR